MKKAKIVLTLLASSLLVSCNGDNGETSSSSNSSASSSSSSSSQVSSDSSSSSSSSSSSVNDGTISFEDLYKEVCKLQSKEISGAKTTTYKNEEVTSAISKVSEETYTSYLDGSTTSKGTYTVKEEGKDDYVDPFKRIATRVTDTYKNDDDTTTSYNMFVQVTDFEKGESGNENYRDSASKVFIIGSEDEVGNLSEGTYILKDDFALYASPNLTAKLADCLATLAASSYISQLGKYGIKPTTTEEGNIEYKAEYKYSYDEDGQNIATTINIDYTMNADKNRLLSYFYSTSVTYTRAGEDPYVSKSAQSGSIEYGDREVVLPSDALKPEDYFLARAWGIGLKAKNGFNMIDFGSKEGISIPSSCTEIVGYVSDPEPSTALDLTLIATASSDENVVALDEDGEFVIKGLGTVDLTFSYYKKDQKSGVYSLSTIKYKGLTISEVKPESISFSAYADNSEFGLLSGASKTWGYSVSPSKASQIVTASSSDPSILEVSGGDNGKITLTAKKEGEATITLISESDASIKVSKTFYVLDAETDFASFLTSNTFYCDRKIYDYEAYMTFKADGTGTVKYNVFVEKTTTVKSTYDVSFTYSLSGSSISFDSFGDNDMTYEDGRIVRWIEKDGKPFGFSVSADNYAELAFVVKNA